MKNNQDFYWIFRPHPQSDYYGEEKIFKKTIKSYKLKNAIYCPSYIEMKKLRKYSDYLVTGMGTAAVEFNAESKNQLYVDMLHILVLVFLVTQKLKILSSNKNFNKIDKISKKTAISKKIIFFRKQT